MTTNESGDFSKFCAATRDRLSDPHLDTSPLSGTSSRRYTSRRKREGLSVRPENVGDRRMRDDTFSSVIGVGVLLSELPLTIRLVASAGRRLRRNARPGVK